MVPHNQPNIHFQHPMRVWLIPCHSILLFKPPEAVHIFLTVQQLLMLLFSIFHAALNKQCFGLCQALCFLFSLWFWSVSSQDPASSMTCSSYFTSLDIFNLFLLFIYFFCNDQVSPFWKIAMNSSKVVAIETHLIRPSQTVTSLEPVLTLTSLNYMQHLFLFSNSAYSPS